MISREKFFLEKTGPSEVVQKVRIKIGRQGLGAQYSHIQQIHIIRKALKESNWPILMSNAKKATVRASFGPVILSGYESTCEMVDVELRDRINFDMAKKSLNSVLEEGFNVIEVKSIPRFFPSLDETVNLIEFDLSSTFLKGTEEKWDLFWKKSEFIVLKKKSDKEQRIDAKKCVHSWKLNGDKLNLKMRVGPNRTLKPELVVQHVCEFDESMVEIRYPREKILINRTNLFFEKKEGELVLI